jgi:hypothetical protein
MTAYSRQKPSNDRTSLEQVLAMRGLLQVAGQVGTGGMRNKMLFPFPEKTAGHIVHLSFHGICSIMTLGEQVRAEEKPRGTIGHPRGKVASERYPEIFKEKGGWT